VTSRLTLWRCFPWDPLAPEGEPFSASYLGAGQTVGRFDLHDEPPVRYLGESAIHAVGEALAEFRGSTFRPSYLIKLHRRLALVEVSIASVLFDRVADCTNPKVLQALHLGPDELAHHDRRVTQAIARRLHSEQFAGLRWWSSITGAWHTTVLFTDREGRGMVRFGAPVPLVADHPAVVELLPVLGIPRH
jgi:hypothetical protein